MSWQSEYPFKPHYLELPSRVGLPSGIDVETQASAQTVRLHYLDTLDDLKSEEKDSTVTLPTVLCVHGNPTWSFYYRKIAQHLRGRVRVIAVDHIGCGLSDKPTAYDYSLETHTANLIELIDRLNLRKIVLVVHDWGGAIGLGAAVERPKSIDKILILNTAAFIPPYIPLRIAACRIPVVGSFAIRYLNAFAVLATRMAIDRLPSLDRNAKAGLLFPYDSPSHRIAIDAFVKDIPMDKNHRTYKALETLENQLSRLSGKPTAFVWGMKDWCFRPECLRRLQTYFPTAETVELDDVGHYVMEEAPREVLESLDRLLTRSSSNIEHVNDQLWKAR